MHEVSRQYPCSDVAFGGAAVIREICTQEGISSDSLLTGCTNDSYSVHIDMCVAPLEFSSSRDCCCRVAFSLHESPLWSLLHQGAVGSILCFSIVTAATNQPPDVRGDGARIRGEGARFPAPTSLQQRCWLGYWCCLDRLAQRRTQGDQNRSCVTCEHSIWLVQRHSIYR